MKIINTFRHADIEIQHVLIDLGSTTEMNQYMLLFEKCFGKRANITEETFTWFNLDQPGAENYNFGFIDCNNNSLIAAYGLLPVDAMLHGKKAKAVLCTNVMTDPDYAGKGLFVKIGEESIRHCGEQGIAVCLGIPNENAIKGHMKVGWTPFEDISYYEMLKTDMLAFPADSRIQISESDSFNERDYMFDDLFNNDSDFRLTRTSSWLNWRCEKPHSKYRKFKVHENGFVGYFIIKEFFDAKESVKKTHIVDLAFKNEQVLNAILKYAVNIAVLNQSDILNLWAFDSDELMARSLTKCNYKKSSSKNYVILYPIGIEKPIKKIRLSLFDNDVF